MIVLMVLLSFGLALTEQQLHVADFWFWLRGDESNGSTMRNVFLVLGGLAAFGFAFWRANIADDQATSARHQVEAANLHAVTAQQTLMNEQFQKGADMLGSWVLSVRLGGIYALNRLATDHPDLYHVEVMGLFCAFIRYPPKGDDDGASGDSLEVLPEDVWAAVRAVGARDENRIQIEKEAGFTLRLFDANLSLGILSDANLSGAWAGRANLSNAIAARVNLSNAILAQANFTDTDLTDANVSGADFTLGDGEEDTKGLTQAQLDEACADPGNPPKLDGVLDATTGKQLVWKDRPCTSGQRQRIR